MKFRGLLLSLAMLTGVGAAQSLNCNLQGYKAMDGLKAEASGSALTMTWQGEGGQQLRAQFALRNGQPVVQELAARQGSGGWIVLGKDLTPDFQVTTGRRRISGAQRNSSRNSIWTRPNRKTCANGIPSGMHRWWFRAEATPQICHARNLKSPADP